MMKIEHKFSLIEKCQFTLEDINKLQDISTKFKTVKNFEIDDFLSLIKQLEDIEIDSSLEDETRIIAVYLKTKIRANSINLIEYPNKIFEGEFAEEDVEDFNDDNNNDSHAIVFSAKEKSAQRDSVKRLNSLSAEELGEMIVNYTWNKYKQIHNGFDRSIYSQSKNSFWTENDIIVKWETPGNFYSKIIEAEHIAENGLKDRFSSLESNNIGVWATEYKEWIDEQDIKSYTKMSIKQFFKTKRIKASEITIDKIKRFVNK